MSNERLERGAKEALDQKRRLQAEGGYAMIPHYIGRKLMPEMVDKYGGRTARDALAIYLYLHSYVNGDTSRELYMWAFPNFEDIVRDTGIHRNRVATLIAILKSEGLIKTDSVKSGGHKKHVYLPLVYPEND